VLWWSWLSDSVRRHPNETVYRVVLTLWLVSAAVIFIPQIETLMATKIHRLRPPSGSSRSVSARPGSRCARRPVSIRTATGSGCTRVRKRPRRYWPEVRSPVSNWSIYTLPPRNLEAVLAHELAHRLALPRRVSLFLYWLSLPARLMVE